MFTTEAERLHQD